MRNETPRSVQAKTALASLSVVFSRHNYRPALLRLMPIPTLLLMVSLIAATACAQPPIPTPSVAEVDAYIERGMKQLDIPGSAVSLFANGAITHAKGFGAIDSSGTPVTAETPFQLGSISKSFTALIVLQLADEGRLSLDDPISKYIPYFQTKEKLSSDQITVRFLLNHRSGLTTLAGNSHQDTTYRGADAMERVIRQFQSTQLFAVPGERFQYSNANYILLAQLIESIEQSPFEKVVAARIFVKLGMTNSFVQIASDPTSQPAVGHTQWFGNTVEQDFIAGRLMMGPGGITSSASDLATYLIAVFENDPRIMSKALSEALSKERKGGYEFGWEFDAIDGRRVIFHGGLNPGFLAMVKYTPATRQGALVLTNMSGSLEGSFIYGATDYALGLPSAPIAPGNGALVRLWGSLSLTCVLLIAFVFWAYKMNTILAEQATRPTSPVRSLRGSSIVKWLKIGVPAFCLICLAYFLVFVVPQLSGVNVTAVRMFYPDVGLLLILSSGIALLWAVARTTFLIRHRM
jgi:CubicO group peptidase (beta-lactamase class C family)